jgi:hypothetical protein
MIMLAASPVLQLTAYGGLADFKRMLKSDVAFPFVKNANTTGDRPPQRDTIRKVLADKTLWAPPK